MGEEPQEPTKQFPLRSLFAWTFLVALGIALIQRLGGVGTMGLIAVAGFLFSLTGLWLILFAGMLLISIASKPTDDQRLQISKCRNLALIGLLMCLPAAMLILLFGFQAFL